MSTSAEEKPARRKFREAIAAKTPLLLIMSGLPNTGKTTLARRLEDRLSARVFSSDDIIEEEARKREKAYDDVYEETIRKAEREFWHILQNFLEDKRNLNVPAIVDRTNLTKEHRRNLRELAAGRLCFIVYAETRFNMLRPGKTIPAGIVENMIRKLQIPEDDEGAGVLKPEDLEDLPPRP